MVVGFGVWSRSLIGCFSATSGGATTAHLRAEKEFGCTTGASAMNRLGMAVASAFLGWEIWRWNVFRRDCRGLVFAI